MRVYEIDDSTGLPTPRSSMSKEEDLDGTFVGNICSIVNKLLYQVYHNDVHMSEVAVMWTYANVRSVKEDLAHMENRYQRKQCYGAEGIEILEASNFDLVSWKVWDGKRQRYRSKNFYFKEIKLYVDDIVWYCKVHGDTYTDKHKSDIIDVLYNLADLATRDQL